MSYIFHSTQNLKHIYISFFNANILLVFFARLTFGVHYSHVTSQIRLMLEFLELKIHTKVPLRVPNEQQGQVQFSTLFIQTGRTVLPWFQTVSVFLPVTPRPCTCGICCLGPITFHPEVKGKHVKLSAGDRRATRNPLSFRHGVTFSSRPLRVGEKVRMRVERAVAAWHGALRIGFTTVPPGSGPMCPLVIPDLTDRQGFWALPIPENYSSPRTELTFWVKRTGYLRIQTDNGFDHKEEMSQMDTSKPIWAMIDVYGQTTSVLFLGEFYKYYTHAIVS